MRRAISYIRFSSPKQQHGDSKRRQTAATIAYCERNGLTLDDVRLEDLGISAFRSKNVEEGALAGFLEAVRLGKIAKGTVLVVENIDRLSRDQVGKALSLFISILNAGIHIVTLTPEREYTQESINDIGNLIEPIINMQRAHEESAMKKTRGRAAWDGKRAKIGEKKLTGRIPAWLTISKDKTTFEPVTDRVEAVRSIFQRTIDGEGLSAIAKSLNAKETAGIGRVAYWNRSYIHKILRTRAVLGEYQPHVLVDGERTPHGEPLPNYYPRIIEDATFYRAQKALAGRTSQRGRPGTDVKNLFTGILFDSRDKCAYNLVDKGKRGVGPKLVSAGAIRGEPGSRYLSFPYAVFETSFLHVCKEFQATDFEKKDSVDDVSALAGRLAEIDHKISKIKGKMLEGGGIEDSLFDVLAALGAEKKKVAAEMDRVKSRQSDTHAETLGEIRSLADLLATTQGDERSALRVRIKGRIRSLVHKIYMTVHRDKNRAEAVVLVLFTDQSWRVYGCDSDGNLYQDAKSDKRMEIDDVMKSPEFTGFVMERKAPLMTPLPS